MAGYIYCMKNTHSCYGRYVKIGYTGRSPEDRRRELSEKWNCTFTILWDMDVYDPARAEAFIHDALNGFRVIYEFFEVDPDAVKLLAERHFDERWREIEDKEVPPEDLTELAEKDAHGFLMDPPPEELHDPESGIYANYGPDSDTE